MRKITLALLLLASLPARAQFPYQAVVPGRTYAYSNDDGYLLHLRIDSAQIGSFTSRYWNYRKFSKQNFYFSVDSPDWTGNHIIEHVSQDVAFVTNTNIFLIAANKTIGGKWKFCDLPSAGFIEAEVINHGIDTFLGISDSVKLIRLQARDSSGNLLTHNLNNIQMRLSRSYGLLDVLHFNNQYDTTLYSLNGFSNPETGFYNLDAKKVFDIRPGDIRHIQNWIEGGSSFTLPSGIRNYQIRTCLSRQELNNGQLRVITDSIQNIKITYSSINKKFDTTYSESLKHDTIALYYYMNFLDKLDYEPVKSPFYDCNYYCYNTSPSLHFLYSLPNRKVKYRMESFCYDAQKGYWPFPNDWPSQFLYYIEGMGGSYFRYWDMTGFEEYTLPVYYKRGNETEGNPYTWNKLMSSRQVQRDMSYQLYPNPATDHFTFSLNETLAAESNLSLYTIDGHLIRTINLAGSETEIRIPDLSAGCYLIRIQNGEKTSYTRLLKR